MRRTIVIATTLVLTVGVAAVVLAQTDDEPTETAEAAHPLGAIFLEVLDDLVSGGTITEEQSEAIVEALQAKREEIRSERQAVRELLRGFWADGELTEDEIEQLPDWHPWTRITGALEDGVITKDELRRNGRLRHRMWR